MLVILHHLSLFDILLCHSVLGWIYGHKPYLNLTDICVLCIPEIFFARSRVNPVYSHYREWRPNYLVLTPQSNVISRYDNSMNKSKKLSNKWKTQLQRLSEFSFVILSGIQPEVTAVWHFRILSRHIVRWLLSFLLSPFHLGAYHSAFQWSAVHVITSRRNEMTPTHCVWSMAHTLRSSCAV